MMENDSERTLHSEHRKRVRRRFEKEGVLGLEEHVLLELFLYDTIRRADTNPISHRLLDRFGSLGGVFSADYEELLKVKGIGPVTARRISMSFAESRKKIAKELLSKPVLTFERASSSLIWMMQGKGAPDGVFILLDALFSVTDVIESTSENGRLCVPVREILDSADRDDALNLIIGIAPGLDFSDVSGLVGELKICDVIEIDGFDAHSVL